LETEIQLHSLMALDRGGKDVHLFGVSSSSSQGHKEKAVTMKEGGGETSTREASEKTLIGGERIPHKSGGRTEDPEG